MQPDLLLQEHGIYERINIGGYLLWMSVLSILLLRRNRTRKLTMPDTPAELVETV